MARSFVVVVSLLVPDDGYNITGVLADANFQILTTNEDGKEKEKDKKTKFDPDKIGGVYRLFIKTAHDRQPSDVVKIIKSADIKHFGGAVVEYPTGSTYTFVSNINRNSNEILSE